MAFLIKDDKLLNNIMKYGIKSGIEWKENLTANLDTMNNF